MTDGLQDQQHKTDLGSKMGDLKDAAMDQIDKASAQAARIAEGVTDQAREAGEKVREVASTVDTTVRKSLRDQPMTTLAAVAALGFVVGALWKSK